MGDHRYSVDDRTFRSASLGYTTKGREEIFIEKKTHKTMNPKDVAFRECRDSATHPNATPIQLYLDVTGSMGHIPHDLIKEGLPHLMGTLIESGVPDAALLFGAIGDHKCDNAPLQIGQFESGDAELDMWLTRTYLEGNGGGNGGESYPLAWYFASNHVKTDAYEKRKQKGFVFTIGDEPFHTSIGVNSLKEIMGDVAVGEGTYTAEQLLASAQKENHVFHIALNHGSRSCDNRWKELLGDNLIQISDYKDVSKVIANTILTVIGKANSIADSSKPTTSKPQDTETNML